MDPSITEHGVLCIQGTRPLSPGLRQLRFGQLPYLNSGFMRFSFSHAMTIPIPNVLTLWRMLFHSILCYGATQLQALLLYAYSRQASKDSGYPWLATCGNTDDIPHSTPICFPLVFLQPQRHCHHHMYNCVLPTIPDVCSRQP